MKARYFVAVAFLALIAGFWQLGLHRQYVSARTTEITASDQAGADVSSEVSALQAFTGSHMGTATSLFLTAGYNRALAASQTTAPSANGQVYAQAQGACASHADSIAQAKCVQSYLAAHSQPGGNPSAPAVAPNRTDFTKSFTSPAWTADSAGLAMLAAMVALVLAIYTQMLGNKNYY